MWIGFNNGKLNAWNAGIISRVIALTLLLLLSVIYNYSITVFRLTFDFLFIIIIYNSGLRHARRKKELFNFRHFIQAAIWLPFIVFILTIPWFLILPQMIKGFYNWLGWVLFLHE